MSINFNPMVTTNAAGSFNVSSAGFIAGTLLDNPPDLYRIAGGVLDTAETLPMYGGVGISENIPGAANSPLPNLGPIIKRALLLGAAGVANALTAFAIFNQAHSYFNTPQSPVPVANTSMSVNYVRLGSGVRIAVPIDPALVSLDGSIITTPVSWDFVNSQITAYQAAYAANVLTASAWAATNGGQATFTTTTAHGVGVGQYVTITGSTPPGYNGTWLTVAGTAGSTLVVAMPVNPGAITVEGSLAAGGGALPVKVLEVDVGNSMVPVFNALTGFVTWNRSGSCAAILI